MDELSRALSEMSEPDPDKHHPDCEYGKTFRAMRNEGHAKGKSHIGSGEMYRNNYDRVFLKPKVGSLN